MTPTEKLAHMNSRGVDIHMTSYDFNGTKWDMRLEMSAEGTSLKIKVDEALPFAEAIDELYAKWLRVTRQLPEFDPNKTIEYSAATNEASETF